MINKITTAILRKSKFLINDFAYSLNLKKLKIKAGKRIIIYHGVTANANKSINARFISTQVFEEQLLYFKKHFKVLSLEDYFNESDAQQSKFTVALTFDDGYLNNLTEVLPLLEKHKIPATFFISTIREKGYKYLWADLLDLHRYTGPASFSFKGVNYHKNKHEYVAKTGTLKQFLKGSNWETKKELSDLILSNNSFVNEKEWLPYFQLLNENQIKQLSESEFANIGSHALYHNCLTQIPIGAAEEELKTSKEYLEKITRKAVNYFAYPDGDYNEELVKVAEKSGYTKQLLVDYIMPKHKEDKRIEERFGINPYISVKNQIQCIINGRY